MGDLNCVDTFNHIVGTLYDAVLYKEPNHFSNALKDFERTIESDSCHLFALDRIGRDIFTVNTHSEDVDQQIQGYYEHFRHIDPRLEKTLNHVGEAHRCTDFFSASFMNRNEFFQDYLVPMGRVFTAGGMISKTDDCSNVIVFNRYKGRKDFNLGELSAIRRLFPHLRRALHLAMQQEVTSLAHNTQAELLQQQSVGVIGLGKHQQVLFANPFARALLGSLRNLGWRGQALRDHSPLALMGRRAHQERKPQVIRVPSDKGVLVITAWASPPQETSHWLPSVSAASDQPLHTCLMVQLLRPGHRLTPALLQQLYGYTSAEARLAKELAQGTTVEDYANSFHVSVATVRTQLRQVLAKSGHARQQDLIAHLAALHAP